MWEISKQLKVFSCFFVPKFDLLLFYMMERSPSVTDKIWQANWVVLVDFCKNVRKKCHFWICSISYSFVPFPFLGLLAIQLLRPDSSNLPCLYLNFHLEYPWVLSRFCIVGKKCDIYPENSLLQFYFGFDIVKRYPFIFLHIYLSLSHKITYHLLNAFEVENAWFYYSRKWSSIFYVVRNW